MGEERGRPGSFARRNTDEARPQSVKCALQYICNASFVESIPGTHTFSEDWVKRRLPLKSNTGGRRKAQYSTRRGLAAVQV